MASLKVKEVLCIAYSIVLFISGLVLIGLSVVLAYKLFYHFKFVPGGAVGPFIVLFILGLFHMLLTWLGVKGPTREHDFHIILFMVSIIVLLIVECAVGVWSMILWQEAEVEVNLLMRTAFEILKSDFNKDTAWTRVQKKLECCGLTGSKDYISAKGSVPISCYPCEEISSCSVYDKGCKDPFIDYVEKILVEGAVLSFLMCLFMALGLFVFIVYFRALRKERKLRIERRIAIQREVLGSEQSRPQSAYATLSVPRRPSRDDSTETEGADITKVNEGKNFESPKMAPQPPTANA